MKSNYEYLYCFFDHFTFSTFKDEFPASSFDQKWVEMLWNQYFVKECVRSFKELEGDDLEEAMYIVLRRINNHYSYNKDRYLAILKSYDNLKNNLLDGAHTKTINRFNDTPQGSGDYSTNDFTTNVTTNEVNVDLDTLDKLNKLEDMYSDVYKKWIHEFSHFFGEDVYYD